ncbi:MAG: HAMP domain-containing sensor histidine kinase [Acidaminobacteraceae bacterium]
MTIRKQLGIITVSLIFIAIVINSLISVTYIDNYFKSYISQQYDDNVNSIRNYSENVLADKTNITMRTQIELQNFINDPIVSIEIYDQNDNRLVHVTDEAYSMFNSHDNMMDMINEEISSEKKDVIAITNNDLDVGKLVITLKSDVTSSETAKLFKDSLMLGSMISGIIVILFSIVLANYASRKISSDLRETAQFAKSLELNKNEQIKDSTILEIKGLQISLKNLSSKLKLQQNTRKEKVDQLAHETRTPLTILKTYCEGALDGILVMDTIQLESCINQIENLTNLISNVNEVIKYDFEDKILITDKFDVVKEVIKVMKSLNLQFKSKNIKLSYTGIEALEVKLDRSLFSQILYNLLMNAYKFTEIEGSVEVKIGVCDSQYFELQVKDTGCGILNSEISNIFEAYYRSENASSKEGDGLGLYISSNNIKSMDGKIKVVSEKGIGSEFIVTLPINTFIK